jgi:predicted acylesterase/phospholipase RssA
VKQLKFAAGLLLACLLGGGCASSYVNEALVPTDQRILSNPLLNRTRSGATMADADGWFVGLAISGGGLRSANFAAACMFELQKLGLLDRVDYISSVSGGSLAAALYCASTDEEWKGDAVLAKLTHTYRSDLIVRVLAPWNNVALWLSDWDRTDILADRFSEIAFMRDWRHLRYGDLNPRRPRLLINSADLGSGECFTFSNDHFDRLRADLSKYPLGNAVAASSAVPAVMAPVTLRDFSAPMKRYIHLVDGGIYDNLGIRVLSQTYRRNRRLAAAAGKPDPYPNGAVFIVLDARVPSGGQYSNQSDVSLLAAINAGLNVMTTELLNTGSSAALDDSVARCCNDSTSVATLRRELDSLHGDGHADLTEQTGKPLRAIYFAFKLLEGCPDLPDKGLSNQVQAIGTDFDIDPADARSLWQAAAMLARHRLKQPLAIVAQDLGARPASGSPNRAGP